MGAACQGVRPRAVCCIVSAKTPTERVEKLRQEREALGLKRRELYAHDEDWPKIQELAAKLQRKRARKK